MATQDIKATVVTSTGGIGGNISSCEMKEKITNTSRESTYSWTEQNTYSVYNTCTNEILSSYTTTTPNLITFVAIPMFTLFGIFVVWACVKLVANIFNPDY